MPRGPTAEGAHRSLLKAGGGDQWLTLIIWTTLLTPLSMVVPAQTVDNGCNSFSLWWIQFMAFVLAPFYGLWYHQSHRLFWLMPTLSIVALMHPIYCNSNLMYGVSSPILAGYISGRSSVSHIMVIYTVISIRPLYFDCKIFSEQKVNC